MAISKHNLHGASVADCVSRGINEALLETEIGFWRDLIASSECSQPPDSIERMRHALALAESRLAQISHKQVSNVRHINSARGERQ